MCSSYNRQYNKRAFVEISKEKTTDVQHIVYKDTNATIYGFERVSLCGKRFSTDKHVPYIGRHLGICKMCLARFKKLRAKK